MPFWVLHDEHLVAFDRSSIGTDIAVVVQFAGIPERLALALSHPFEKHYMLLIYAPRTSTTLPLSLTPPLFLSWNKSIFVGTPFKTREPQVKTVQPASTSCRSALLLCYLEASLALLSREAAWIFVQKTYMNHHWGLEKIYRQVLNIFISI